MDYELAAEIAGVTLAILFLLYTRQKKREPKVENREELRQKNLCRRPLDPPINEPDLISKTAGGIVHAHHFFQKIMGCIFFGVVLVGAVFDSLMRIIVISTIVVMLLIFWIHRTFNRRK